MNPLFLMFFLAGGYYFLKGDLTKLAIALALSISFRSSGIETAATNITPDLPLAAFMIILVILLMLQKRITITLNPKTDAIALFIPIILGSSIIASFMARGELVWPVGEMNFGTSASEAQKSLVPLLENGRAFTQTIFIAYPLFMFLLFARLNLTTVKKMIQAYLHGVIFVSLLNVIAFLELTLFSDSFVLKVSSWLTGGYVGNYETGIVSSYGIPRISALSGEPSLFSFVALPAFAYSLMAISIDPEKFKFWLFSSVVLLLALLVSGSTAGILTSLIIFLLIAIVNFRNRLFLSALIFLGLIFIYLLTTYFEFFNQLFLYNFSKIFGSNESSMGIRLWSILHSLKLFLAYPLFGIGVGSSSALSGAATVLVSHGVIGLLVLLGFLIQLLKNQEQNRSREFKYLMVVGLALVTYNLGAGDLSSFYSLILALFMASLFAKDIGPKLLVEKLKSQ